MKWCNTKVRTYLSAFCDKLLFFINEIIKKWKKIVPNQCSPKGICRGEKEKYFWNAASCIVHDFWEMLEALGNLL